jgi:ABC-type microcin C transport system permease subunit YejB
VIVFSDHPHPHSHVLFPILRMTAIVLAAPFVLAVLLIALVATLSDFTWFRLRTALSGEHRPKGLWEF